ncbi:hypothetical protein FAF44_02650 [Nonomuraea sp. MG754425]|uniref:hypothetical protein n=1 Tax=Nonomuraea sp. MG754425 TaxID=2570319 RepID=UPI001F3AB5A4|nr:hypothetical protein [Nonomuraea sp. MG754425]MCF6467313.1 hypothetical protein [Nonomuraea sp. MG754425]
MTDNTVMLDWQKRPLIHHTIGCILCCDIRVQASVGSSFRHPKNCTNCVAYSGPRPDPCWSCGVTAHFRDNDGRATHKVCLEIAIADTARAQTGRRTSR